MLYRSLLRIGVKWSGTLNLASTKDRLTAMRRQQAVARYNYAKPQSSCWALILILENVKLSIATPWIALSTGSPKSLFVVMSTEKFLSERGYRIYRLYRLSAFEGPIITKFTILVNVQQKFCKLVF